MLHIKSLRKCIDHAKERGVDVSGWFISVSGYIRELSFSLCDHPETRCVIWSNKLGKYKFSRFMSHRYKVSGKIQVQGVLTEEDLIISVDTLQRICDSLAESVSFVSVLCEGSMTKRAR